MTLMALNAISQGQTTSSSSARSVNALITLIRFRYKDDSMKARVKATGEIVEVMYSHTLYDIIWYITPRGACFSEEELDLIDTGESLDYWTRLEHQYAGMAMQGILSSESIIQELDRQRFVNRGIVLSDMAINYAHALIQKLKEKEEK